MFSLPFQKTNAPPTQNPNQELGPENVLIPAGELAAEEAEEFQLHGRRLMSDWQIGFVEPQDSAIRHTLIT